MCLKSAALLSIKKQSGTMSQKCVEDWKESQMGIERSSSPWLVLGVESSKLSGSKRVAERNVSALLTAALFS